MVSCPVKCNSVPYDSESTINGFQSSGMSPEARLDENFNFHRSCPYECIPQSSHYVPVLCNGRPVRKSRELNKPPSCSTEFPASSTRNRRIVIVN
jgi:hypothetical protein